jgi:hypothetical protein
VQGTTIAASRSVSTDVTIPVYTVAAHCTTAHISQVNPDTMDKLINAAKVGELSVVSTTDPV